MSCRLSLRSSLNDLDGISEFLGDGDSKQQSTEQTKRPGTPGRPKSLLVDCIISLSPAEDILVLGKDTNAIFLTNKSCLQVKDDPQSWNHICWKGNLCQSKDEYISAVLCVPLASQLRSSQGIPDCSCVIVGFTSGYVRIYLQTGIQLLSQFLHDGPVSRIDLKTKLPAKDNYASDQGEELIILYANAVVVIDGFSLFMALKACRNQIAKAQASKFQDPIQPPPLAYRKWKLMGQEKVYDIANCGMMTSSVFDRLVASSLAADSRPILSKNSLSGTRKFIASGANPFIGWYELKEENTAPLMSEVAMNVASKLTTAVISSISSATSDWLGLGIPNRFRAQPAKEAKTAKPPVEAGTPIKLRYGLPDKRRQAESIVLSPDGTLVACTDDFGRILVISNDSGLVVRMLKGYREAECGWIVVDDQSDEQATEEAKIRQALFLVIYAPRRGILEIWLAEQGNRVGAFSVGKDCRLIYNSHGTLGSRTSSHGMLGGSCVTCFLLEGSGNLSSINVPFHCSLSLLHSLRARDSFLLRKVSAVVEKGFSATKKDDQIATLTQLLQEMEAPDTLFQVVQRISSTQKLSSTEMATCLSAIKEILGQKDEEIGAGDDLEYQAEIRGMISLCTVYLDLIKLFAALNKLSQETASSKVAEVTPQDLVATLELSTKDAELFLSALDRTEDIPEAMTVDQTELTIAEFLSLFTYETAGSGGQSETPREPVTVSMKDCGDGGDQVERLASLYYKSYIENSLPLSELDLLISCQYFDAESCMCLLLIYCKTKELRCASKLKNIHDIMKRFIDAACSSKEDNTKSMVQYWSSTRSMLERCNSTRNCLLIAYLCKSIASSLQSEEKRAEEAKEIDPNWLDVDRDIEEWMNIIVKLEDLFVLESFLHKGHYDNTAKDDVNQSLPKISIKELSNAGKGSITQIVAAQIVRCRIPGPCVANVNPTEETSELKKSGNSKNTENQNSEILQALKELQSRFPYSLERDALLAHCCWECVLQWKRDVEDVSVLSSAVVHLSTISSIILKQGLALLFWKAVFKECVKNTYNLIEKVGKSPKDRLCRKHIGMSINALERYLFTACSLLRQIIQAEDDAASIEFPEFQVEKRWEIRSRSNCSVIESALDEPKCDIAAVRNLWTVTTVLRFIVFTGMKSVVSSKLFIPEKIRASIQMFPNSCELPQEADRSMQNEQLKFCLGALSLLVERASIEEEEQTQTDLVSTSNDLFELCNNFRLDDENLWQSFACNLFSAGLDSIGYEALLSVHQKEDMVDPLLNICGSRLARILIDTDDVRTVSKVISSLPTHLTSWLQARAEDRIGKKTSTVKENIMLLNKILSLSSIRNDFVKDLIDGLEMFL